MPSASQLIEDYIKANPQLSETSKSAYRREATKYGGLDMDKANARTIKKLVEESTTNPNTRASMLNIALMLLSHKHTVYDRLTDYSLQVRQDIDKMRKEKLAVALDKLPSYDYLLEQLDKMEGLQYIVNFMLIKQAFRNADLNLMFVKNIPDSKDDNYIYLNPKTGSVKVVVNNYKTKGSYGTKNIVIDNERLTAEMKKLKLEDGEYLFKTRDGKKPSVSYLGEIIKRLSIDGLAEANIAKVVIKHLIDQKDFASIRDISRSRGTSESTLLANYNLYDNK